ncbi:anti-sigma factor antagonist [Leptospira gomenensis]|uniref:Anti-sigma factor antagonist n=2 Tax=Leptospira gomenensis TaxID=2484974 RepID=A0A5F1YAN8_9LEPT|nr:anti-sigma factor antagonist [Leptospira gomenensis]TGK41860.1 anti-sigma factor antagonist [Leptospira gomenensis]TGK44797.1 anti-sigma factor antagonist [Leptospira gomenensis]TGK65184.1 anti-sigma factor antagonist [Leptospira gomenensis]
MVFNEKVYVSMKLKDFAMDHDEFRNYLNSHLEKNPSCVVLDFAEVEAVTSVALGVLVGFSNRLRALGIELESVNVSDRLKQILRLVSLDRAFGPL